MEVRWRGCGLGTHDVMLLNEACFYLSFVVFGNYNRLSTVRFDGEIWRGSKIFRFTSKNYLYMIIQNTPWTSSRCFSKNLHFEACFFRCSF